jgi:hypothetical protein
MITRNAAILLVPYFKGQIKQFSLHHEWDEEKRLGRGLPLWWEKERIGSY